jgi:hypothetical protein
MLRCVNRDAMFWSSGKDSQQYKRALRQGIGGGAKNVTAVEWAYITTSSKKVCSTLRVLSLTLMMRSVVLSNRCSEGAGNNTSITQT